MLLQNNRNIFFPCRACEALSCSTKTQICSRVDQFYLDLYLNGGKVLAQCNATQLLKVGDRQFVLFGTLAIILEERKSPVALDMA